jgi:hypothetical protein
MCADFYFLKNYKIYDYCVQSSTEPPSSGSSGDELKRQRRRHSKNNNKNINSKHLLHRTVISITPQKETIQQQVLFQFIKKSDFAVFGLIAFDCNFSTTAEKAGDRTQKSGSPIRSLRHKCAQNWRSGTDTFEEE